MYLKLAPEQIYFYDRDGLPIASLKAAAGDHTAIEVIHKVKKQVEAVPEAAPGKQSAERAEVRISEDGRTLIYEQG
ncbi:hypothetical protein [Paenibacillus sp. FSL H8-0537]|uniref:hypothetical protein n=1 Tax=Paenibacillus sp. FSL H8-0537 TaxID=2921399 RepID=UPI003100C71F